jgi:hypothetical protein
VPLPRPGTAAVVVPHGRLPMLPLPKVWTTRPGFFALIDLCVVGSSVDLFCGSLFFPTSDIFCPSVLRIRDVYFGSRIRIFSIPDPNFFHPRSEFFPSRIRIKELKYCNPNKWFLRSRKYDPGCSSGSGF